MVYRIYSEKKKEFAVEAGALASDLAPFYGFHLFLCIDH